LFKEAKSSSNNAELTYSQQGHETTASLLSWTVKLLTNAPVEQARLRDALRAHFPSSPQTPPVEAILAANIPYLDASIEELLRKSNVIPEIVREAACDAELLGHRVPKGATLVCSTYVAHKPFAVPDAMRSVSSRADTAYGTFWQTDMNEFHPERWLRADGSFDAKALPRLAFGTGARACFGKDHSFSHFSSLPSEIKFSGGTDRGDRSKIRDAAVPHPACRDVADLRASPDTRPIEQLRRVVQDNPQPMPVLRSHESNLG
jgi:hypothetical protein